MPIFIPAILFTMLLPLVKQAQQGDSVSQFRPLRSSIRHVSIPGMLAVSGIILNSNQTESFTRELVEERNELIPGFHTHIDNFLQYRPIAVAMESLLPPVQIGKEKDMYHFSVL